MAKYDPLSEFLNAQGSGETEHSFAEIDRLASGGLPLSARRHRPWWGNETNPDRVHAASWLRSGRKVVWVDLAGERVRFSARGA